MAMFEASELAIGRGAPLIRGLSFTLEAGQRVALAGPSGVGKSTALRAIAALDPLHGGSLELDGESPEVMGVPHYRRRVVYVAQRARFFSGTALDELRRPFGYESAERAFPAEHARELLGRLGVQHTLKRPANELSEGEQQRVAFVRALLLEPFALLLDEPTSALDESRARDLEALLLESASALVWVSHDSASHRRLGAEPIDLAPLRVGDA